MRKAFPEIVERGRVLLGHYGSCNDDPYGAFNLIGPCGIMLRVLATDGEGGVLPEVWEHVSVSTERRPPNWQEMSWIKELFFEDEDCVMQLHPPKSQYINCHPFTLHLWRPRDLTIPMPPRETV